MSHTTGHSYVCAGTGPGTVQYDACHAADQQTIAALRALCGEAAEVIAHENMVFRCELVGRLRDAALRGTEGP